jgi:hypothetical protein
MLVPIQSFPWVTTRAASVDQDKAAKKNIPQRDVRFNHFVVIIIIIPE